MNSRAIAAKVLDAIFEQGQSLSTALPQYIEKYPELRDPQLMQELCYGVLRQYYYLQALCEQLLPKPLKQKDSDLHYLLLIGIYQLQFLNIPPHASISETVNAAKMLKKEWAKGLVNAVLRQFQREQHILTKTSPEELTQQFNHPLWLIEKLQQAWPEHWQAILLANNQHPPMTLRVNQRFYSREKYIEKLQQANILATVHATVDTAIELIKPVNVNKLPGFKNGWVSVQDAASQLAATLLELAPQQRILDACAAPGGKTCHILETEPNLAELVAIDIDAERLQRVTENLQRLRLQATVYAGDANQPSNWWDGNLFDRILCDAPCSATGVIRRHPDIKYLRQPNDLDSLHQQQVHLLQRLWPLLKVGGKLVYSTCSIFPRENVEVISAFLQAESTARSIPINGKWGIEQTHGRQILPGENGMDGFYYAVLEKTAG